MEKEIVVGNRTFKVKEIIATEMDDIDFQDRKEFQKALCMKGASLSEEEYNNLTFKERIYLIKEITDINGLGDFQQTSGVKSV